MRTVVVVEGTEAVGIAITRAFQEAGDRVVVVSSSAHADSAEQLCVESSLPVYVWDLVDWTSCQEGMRAIENEHGPVDVLVHNGHLCKTTPLSQMTLQEWLTTLNTNLTSLFCVCQSLVGSLSQRGGGRIIAMGSLYAHQGEKGLTHYSASQAGIVGFARSLAAELAPYGTTVNVIAHGDVRQDEAENIPVEELEASMHAVPLRRMGTPEEVAALALFLASPAASFITGTTLHMNGGRWMNGM